MQIRISDVAVLAVALLSGGAAAHAAPAETFGKWSVDAKDVDTGEDVRRTCTASTSFADAAGNVGTLTLTISNGDVLPPDAYPAVAIAVTDGNLPAGDDIPAVFGDGNGRVEATAYASSGAASQRRWQLNNVTATTVALLRAMRRADALDLTFAGRPVGSIPMGGFTKTYRRLGALCGFATGDVAP